MGLQLRTGKNGKNVTSDSDGRLYAGVAGTDRYVLNDGNQLAASLSDSNTLVVQSGAMLINGRHVTLDGTQTWNIPNGAQGKKRSNLCVVRYTKDSNGIEITEAVTLSGDLTDGDPVDPAYNNTSILQNGTTISDYPLYRVITDGISANDPVPLFNVLTPLATIGASVDQIKVEQRGTSGIWEYAKYSNGIAECWGIDYTGSFNINTLWGNGFYISDNVAARNYPFTFKSAPREFAQITLVNPANHNTVYTGIKSLQAVNSTSKTCAYQMLRSGSGTGFAAKIEYYVRGEWK